MALPLALILARVARWLTYADFTCPDPKPWLDREHAPGCPHPLLARRRT